MDTQRLNETGYDAVEKFSSSDEVREYFTVQNMEYMFGDEADFGQDELEEMADYVIENKLNYEG